ncbi:uncharacterized protein [Onthophagus taurus]|uniref:uncharacterized protein n=1 Tax=Onthophagus taurus TaxID=166361 RepID=UPI0039BEC272
MNDNLEESVQSALDDIIRNDYKTPPEIEITQGSQEGDGYASKTYAISIKGDNGKNTDLFVKYLPEDIKSWEEALIQAFNTEYKFYTEIYPTFDEFQKTKNVQEPFDNVPKHFNTKMKKDQVPPIVLEDLRSSGYTLRDRRKPIDDAHLNLSIKAFARYHAINYALKDQHPEKYKKLTIGVDDVFGKYFKQFGMGDMMKGCVSQLIEYLDPVADKNIIKHLENLGEKLIDYLTKIFRDYDEYFVIAQGDCWSNNMMFLYNDQNDLPIDVKLIDWQCQRISSPLLDFSYFFYTLATKKELDNAEYFLTLYYNTLSERIAELGSNPEIVYPYKIFREHWRKYSLFGLCMALGIIKAQLFEKDEVPNLLNSDSEEKPMDVFNAVLKNQDIYVERMRNLAEYFIDNDLLSY